MVICSVVQIKIKDFCTTCQLLIDKEQGKRSKLFNMADHLVCRWFVEWTTSESSHVPGSVAGLNPITLSVFLSKSFILRSKVKKCQAVLVMCLRL